MTPLTWILAGALVGLAILVFGTGRAAERAIGWRYLFRRRRSRTVLVGTAILGVLAVGLPTLFLLTQGTPGSPSRTLLLLLTEPVLILFVIFLLLNFFSALTTVSILGVFLGVASLMVVLSVTSGFQEEFQNKVLGVNSHVIVLKYGINFSEYRDVASKVEKLPHVKAAAPFTFNEMMIAHGSSLSGVLVKGILPGESTRVLDIEQRMIEGDVGALETKTVGLAPPGASDDNLPTMLLGRELAKKLKAKPGDRVRLVAPLADLDPSLWTAESRIPKTKDFRVAGVFYSGFDEYDRRLVYIHLRDGQLLTGGGDAVTGVEMRIDDIYASARVSAEIERALAGAPYRVIDWRELNHNLFTALKMQKFALAILLTLIILVAAFGIVATLTMLVIDKSQEIAILKSMGMRSSAVARVFQAAGLTVGALGVVAGIAHGLILCVLMRHYQYQLDPRVYLIDHLPVRIDVGDILLTALITLAICLVATIYPAARAASLRPVEGLRYE